ncbi:hypothetical protein V525_21515 [Gordonia alkanivorans CGMCC 6845]|uniref:Uncharacterized protein n=1 Tax=Gordonia alkanivorans CGMCC 6845 TaxID=1423140 RepID=W9D9A5_9ACTN|nr:hypothetical protein V525_21515 [Gordonia alkanivorans CGMCC 6845]
MGFVGEIPHAHEFGPMRRELLLSQVGAAAAARRQPHAAPPG